MTLEQLQGRLDFAVEVAWRAGRAALAHYQTGVAAEAKPDASPVTAADRAAERTARELIADRFPDDAILGGHLSLTCVALDRLAEDGLDPSGIPEMTAESFKAWMIKHGFSTYEAAADAFGMTRQGVHNWFSRNSFPRWLALATLGYDLGARVAAKDSGGGA